MLCFVDDENDWLGNAPVKRFQCFRKGSAARLAYRFELESELTLESRQLAFGACFSDPLQGTQATCQIILSPCR